MASINWDDIEEQYGSQYKDYAEDGVYKVKCDGVEIKDAGTKGNKVVKFHFEDTDDFQFPTYSVRRRSLLPLPPSSPCPG